MNTVVFALLVYSASAGVWPVSIEMYFKAKDCEVAKTKLNAMWAPDYTAHCAMLPIK